MAKMRLRNALHTPPETAAKGVDYIQALHDNKHRQMPYCIDVIREYLAPLMPGNTLGIIAQTSNYKSGLINFWERYLADYLSSAGRDEETIIHVDTEETVETLAMNEIAVNSKFRVPDLVRGNVTDWKGLRIATGKIVNYNILRIAHTLGAEDQPDLHLSNIQRIIEHAVAGDLFDGRKIRPAIIFVDYLQALDIDPEVRRGSKLTDQRRLQVRDDIFRIKKMARVFDCSLVVGIQAKQALEGHAGPNMRIPGTYDGEETSAIAQRLDRLIAQWMPKSTHRVGDFVDHHGTPVEIAEDRLWQRVNKQRGGLPAGKAWECTIDYDTNSIRVIS